MGREGNREMCFERKGLHYRSSCGRKKLCVVCECVCECVFGYVDFK